MPEALIASAIPTLPEAKAYLARASITVDDDPLAVAVNGVAGQVEIYCHRKLKSRAYAPMTVSGSASATVVLPQWPITAFSAAAELSTTGAARTINIAGWRVSTRGVLWLPNDVFGKGFRNIELTCTAGYTFAAHPEEWDALRLASLRWIQSVFLDQQNGVGRGTGFSAGGESVSLIDVAVPKDVAFILDRFLRLS